MPKPSFIVHAREQVRQFVPEADLDRLTEQACEAAERSPGWQPGGEFVFWIEEEPYSIPGIELSSLTVCHRGTDYEVFYYDGQMAETITANPSWGARLGDTTEPGPEADPGRHTGFP
jgi:hypothetical protein